MTDDPRLAFNRTMMSMWMPQALHAAAELGIADAIADAPRTSAEIAKAIAAHPETTERLCSALTAIDVLKRDGARFAASRV